MEMLMRGEALICSSTLIHTLIYFCFFQISTLVSHRERALCSERSIRAVARVGQAVNLAVERFVTIGETIADDNPEIKTEMYQACKEARAAGKVYLVQYLIQELAVVNSY